VLIKTKLISPKIILSAWLATFALSTKSQGQVVIADGLYKGKFKVVYAQDQQVYTGKTSLLILSPTFVSTGNKKRIPAGGSGTFTVSGNKIVFHEENMWTADFDWNLIMNGEFDFTYDGKRLCLIAERANGRYEYVLVKK
jgi:hypothetical protein